MRWLLHGRICLVCVLLRRIFSLTEDQLSYKRCSSLLCIVIISLEMEFWMSQHDNDCNEDPLTNYSVFNRIQLDMSFNSLQIRRYLILQQKGTHYYIVNIMFFTLLYFCIISLTLRVVRCKSDKVIDTYQNHNQKYLFGHIPDPGDLF